MFEKVNRFYDLGLYGATQVAAFVARGKLTAEQYADITGLPYTVV